MTSPLAVIRASAPDPRGAIASTRPFHFSRDGTVWIQSTGVVVASEPLSGTNAGQDTRNGPIDRLKGRRLWILTHASGVTPCLDIEAAVAKDGTGQGQGRTANSRSKPLSGPSSRTFTNDSNASTTSGSSNEPTLPQFLPGAEISVLLSPTSPYLPATLQSLVPCPGIASSLKKLMASSGSSWRLGWGGIGLKWADLNRVSSMGEKAVGLQTVDVTHLALLSVDLPENFGMNVPDVFNLEGRREALAAPPSGPTPGDPLLFLSHPFSLVNPEMFWGSAGSGVIANIVWTDSNKEVPEWKPGLLITDARYLAGSEGGLALYSSSRPDLSGKPNWTRPFAGLILPPLCRLDSWHPPPPPTPPRPPPKVEGNPMGPTPIKSDSEREREREIVRIQPIEFSVVIPGQSIKEALERAGFEWIVGSSQSSGSNASTRPLVVPANLSGTVDSALSLHSLESTWQPPVVPSSFRTLCPMVTVSSPRAGTTWASGVLIVGHETNAVFDYLPKGATEDNKGPKKGYILTNAHVILPHIPQNPRSHNRSTGPKAPERQYSNYPQHATTTPVRLPDWETSGVRCSAKIWLPDSDGSGHGHGSFQTVSFLQPIFISPAGSPWDIAILGPVYSNQELENVALWNDVASTEDAAVEGVPAAAIGHGVFGPSSELAPAVTRGLLRRAVRLPGSTKEIPPIQLHSTAAVHNGSSGGLLLSYSHFKDKWEWTGLVCSNLSFTPPGASGPGGDRRPMKIPVVNFAIPMSILRPLLAGLFDGSGTGLLQAFCLPADASSGGDDVPGELAPLVDLRNAEFIKTVWQIGFSRRPEEDGEIGRRRARVKELVEGRKKWIEEQERKARESGGANANKAKL